MKPRKLISILSALIMCLTLLPSGRVFADETISAEIPVTCTYTADIKIEAVSKDAPMPESDTLSISEKKPGKYVITYHVPGTYEYKVYQLPHKEKDVKIDDVVYEVVVTVYYDDADVLHASVVSKSSKTGAKPDKLHFDNTRPSNPSNQTNPPMNEANTGVGGENLLLKAGLPITAGVLMIIGLLATRKKKRKTTA